jgi:hypothetical protein
VLGDIIASAPGLPKSGHTANQSGKTCAATIAAEATGAQAPAEPVIANTCYSFVSAGEAMHVAGVYRYGAQKKMVVVKGAGGLSKQPSAVEAMHAIGWAFNILHDTFGSRLSLQDTAQSERSRGAQSGCGPARTQRIPGLSPYRKVKAALLRGAHRRGRAASKLRGHVGRAHEQTLRVR